jgi:alkanesulfonate monooxygenase SsuD/methylene tetrahydromethanopterin reductase-like flavin-dependent oxidoreductase (luciferase family)
MAERFDRFEEQLAIITGLWATGDGETFSFDGQHYHVSNSPALPRPAQRPGPPVIIGGSGRRRTPMLAARYADEFNTNFVTPQRSAEIYGWVREACEAAGRDHGSMRLSTAQTVACGKGEAEVARRAAAIGRDPAELRVNGLAGTPAEIVDKIGQLAEVGASTVYLQVLDLSDLDHLELLAAEVLRQV